MMDETQKKTVLIVDDTPDNLDVLRGILQDDYKVKVATSGSKCLNICQSDKKPDLILLDIMMPVMDGMQVLKKLKADENTKAIPVIFVTSLDEVENESSGLEMGAVDYITKPVNAAVVLARVKTHLELVESRKSVEQLLSRTLSGSVKLLTDILGMLNKEALQFTTRVREMMTFMVKDFQLEGGWRFEISALLSHIGCVILDPSILAKFASGRTMTAKEEAILEQHAFVGSTLIRNIPRLEDVASMIGGQRATLQSNELKKDVSEIDATVLGGQMLRTSIAFERGIRYYDPLGSIQKKLLGEYHHPQVVDSVYRFLNGEEAHVPEKKEILTPPADKEEEGEEEVVKPSKPKTSEELNVGMVVRKDIISKWGMVVVKAGTRLNTGNLATIKRMEEAGHLESGYQVD